MNKQKRWKEVLIKLRRTEGSSSSCKWMQNLNLYLSWKNKNKAEKGSSKGNGNH